MNKLEQVLGFEISYFKYAGIGAILSLIFLALFAFLVNKQILPDKYFIITIIAVFLATFVSAFLKGKNSSKNRLFSGVLVAILIFMIFFALALITGPVDFSIKSIGSVSIAILLAGIFGGFLSTYTKKPKKNKSKKNRVV